MVKVGGYVIYNEGIHCELAFVATLAKKIASKLIRQLAHPS